MKSNLINPMALIKKPKLITITIIIFIILGIGFRFKDFSKPWTGVHNAWGGVMYGAIARNYVKYGYLETRFAPVANSGYVSSDEFEFYYHYPPLLVWLVSVSYFIFGVHEWAARLVPLIFSLFSLGLIYEFARYLFSKKVALLALLFGAIIPMETYYGAHVDVYCTLSVFFPLLAIYGYARWLEDYRLRNFVICTIGIFLGCMTSWNTYFIVPLILAHSYFFNLHERKKQFYRLLILPGVAITIFLLFLLHREILLGSGKGEIHETLIQKLLIRTSLITASSGEKSDFFRLFFIKNIRYSLILYSPFLIINTAIWGYFFIRDALKKQLQKNELFLIILLLYGILHNLIFSNILENHAYIVVLYSSGIVLTNAAVIIRVYNSLCLKSWNVYIRKTVISAYLFITILSCFYITHKLYLRRNYNPEPTIQQWSRIIHQNCTGKDLILFPTKSDQIIKYYVDLKMMFEVNTLDKIFRETKNTEGNILFCLPTRQINQFEKIYNYMIEKYPHSQSDGIIVFKIR